MVTANRPRYAKLKMDIFARRQDPDSEFQKIRKETIKDHKYITSLEIIIYIVAVFILFGLGGKIADLAEGQVPLISIDGIIKMAAIICMLILVAIIFIPGPVIVMSDIGIYFKYKDQGDKMIVDLSEDTQNLLDEVKKELGQSLSDNEVIKDALALYYSDVVQINRQKDNYK